MAEIEQGGPAFPHDKYIKHDGQWGTYAHGGMTLRDYFAASMVSGFATRDGDFTHVEMSEMAEWAYDMADALLAAREAK